MVDDKIIKPEDIPPTRSEKILVFFNSVHTPEEIAAVVKLPGRDVGVKLARNSLTRRMTHNIRGEVMPMGEY